MQLKLEDIFTCRIYKEYIEMSSFMFKHNFYGCYTLLQIDW
jgi:hypothetical protein